MLTNSRVLIAFLLPVLFAATAVAQSAALNSCDLNADGVVDKADVDLSVSMSLGQTVCNANIAGPGVCDAVVVQRIVNAALGGDCRLSGGSHSVELTWAASESSGVAGYNVFRSSTTGGPYTLLTSKPVAGTRYLDTAVQAGKTYFYVVAAVDTSNVSSVYSNEATAQIPAA